MTATPAPPRRYTVADLLAMPDGDQYELVDGVLREKHSGVNANLTATSASAQLERHAQAAGGYLLKGQQYQIFPDPGLVRRPDLSYFRPSRIPSLHERIVRTGPDFVVEITSRSSSTVDDRLKVQAWLEAGVELVWVLLPELREVTVYERGARPRVFTSSDPLSGAPVLPEFSIVVADLFPAMPAPAGP